MISRAALLLGLLFGTPTDGAVLDDAKVFSSRVVSGNATVVVKSGAGTLRTVVVGNAATGGTITVYDATSATGTPILVVVAGTPSGGLLSGSGNPAGEAVGPLDIMFNTGLTVVTSGSNANSFTLVYQ